MLKSIINTFTNKFYVKLLYIFTSLSLVTIISDFPYFDLFNKLTLAYALVLSGINLLELIYFKRRRIFSFEICSYLFLLLTLILNLKVYFYSYNIKAWLITFMIFTVIFSIDIYKTKKELNFEINFISTFYSIINFILSLGSLIIIFMNKYSSNENKYLVNYFGLYKNENSFGIAASIAILVSLFLYFNIKNKTFRIFNIVNIVIQGISLITSNGRSGYLILLGLFFLCIIFILKKPILQIIFTLIPIITSLFLFNSLSNEVLHKFLTGRQYIWRSAIRVIKAFPLTGVGNLHRNDTIESFRVEILNGVKFGGVHNVFLEVGVINGLLALTLFLLFLILLLLSILKLFSTKNIKFNKYFVLFSLVVGLLFVNLLESSIAYIISFISIIFYTYSGYLFTLLYNSEDK